MLQLVHQLPVPLQPLVLGIPGNEVFGFLALDLAPMSSLMILLMVVVEISMSLDIFLKERTGFLRIRSLTALTACGVRIERGLPWPDCL